MQNIDELRESIGRQISDLSLEGEIVPRPDTLISDSDGNSSDASTAESLASDAHSLFAFYSANKRSKWRRWKTQDEIRAEIARCIQRSRDAAAQERAEILAAL